MENGKELDKNKKKNGTSEVRYLETVNLMQEKDATQEQIRKNPKQ